MPFVAAPGAAKPELPARPGPSARSATVGAPGGSAVRAVAGFAAFPPVEAPLWLVSAPTVAPDGRAGEQSFVVPAVTLGEALVAAGRRAATRAAAGRRRGARIDLDRATAVRHR
ncbi:hypothetical protein [Kitasatospora sp. NBC_01539]|uniref:hypothetical protein n=1 Tax=Kitasatospora sp. NBC_01539 TaxID=2903577 RepID=UPI0038602986